MPGRQDALVASAEIIGSVQTISLDHAPEGVGTVGELYVQPNSRNTIPGEVWFSVDIRNPQDDALESMGNQFRQICDECAVKHRVVIEVDEIWTKPPVRFDQKCIDAVSEAVSGLGYSNQQIVSGAGHDACQVCQVVPTSMIFVPCAGGSSHNEHESAEPEDIEAGANVLLYAMLNLSTWK
jgi:N-carbamoyl-L-amino-acid hydrolase